MFRFVLVFVAPLMLTAAVHATAVAPRPGAIDPTFSARAAAAQTSGSTDDQLASKVKAGLDADSELKGRSIAVKASKGTVTLEGEVSSVVARAKAGELAQRIDGVKKVNNKLKLAK